MSEFERVIKITNSKMRYGKMLKCPKAHLRTMFPNMPEEVLDIIDLSVMKNDSTVEIEFKMGCILDTYYNLQSERLREFLWAAIKTLYKIECDELIVIFYAMITEMAFKDSRDATLNQVKNEVNHWTCKQVRTLASRYNRNFSDGATTYRRYNDSALEAMLNRTFPYMNLSNVREHVSVLLNADPNLARELGIREYHDDLHLYSIYYTSQSYIRVIPWNKAHEESIIDNLKAQVIEDSTSLASQCNCVDIAEGIKIPEGDVAMLLDTTDWIVELPEETMEQPRKETMDAYLERKEDTAVDFDNLLVRPVDDPDFEEYVETQRGVMKIQNASFSGAHSSPYEIFFHGQSNYANVYKSLTETVGRELGRAEPTREVDAEFVLHYPNLDWLNKMIFDASGSSRRSGTLIDDNEFYKLYLKPMPSKDELMSFASRVRDRYALKEISPSELEEFIARNIAQRSEEKAKDETDHAEECYRKNEDINNAYRNTVYVIPVRRINR